jgi:uncharacterized protein YdhG (YjbR/CyaY superfamily)
MRKHYRSTDEYINSFPDQIRKKLLEMREIIREEAPGAQEKISYQIPAFYLNGNLVYFAGYVKHIGFYPTSSGIKNFRDKLSKYKYSKGAVQFPLDKPLPAALIRKIVKFRVAENAKRGEKPNSGVKRHV